MAKSMSSQNDQSIEKLANPKRFKINDLKLQQFVKSKSAADTKNNSHTASLDFNLYRRNTKK